MSIRFYNDNDSINIPISHCIILELILNKDINYKDQWIDLGDILYSWGSKTNYKNLMDNNQYFIDQEKIDWLRNNINNI
jgi:hypothetical protein